MPKEFTYRGHTIEHLKDISMDEFILLLPARQRRSLQRGLTSQQRAFFEELKKYKRTNGGQSKKAIKTHCRDMIILPEMIDLTILVHTGKEFFPVEIKPQMIGHFLGEFAITNKKVSHGTPGIGASRSSMYVPLK
jgi:small subunit ribosomal protein S19